MNLYNVMNVGRQTILLMCFTLTAAFVTAYVVSKLLKIDGKTGVLIGVGTSICGGSAIAATAPVIDASDEEIAHSISTIFLFNVIAAFLFPFLGRLLGMSDTNFGMWAGTAVNEHVFRRGRRVYVQQCGRRSGGHRQTDAHAHDCARHACFGSVYNEKIGIGRSRAQRLQNCKNIPVVCHRFSCRVCYEYVFSHTIRRHPLSLLCRKIRDCHGHGIHRSEHQSVQFAEKRYEADSPRFYLLGRFIPGFRRGAIGHCAF